MNKLDFEDNGKYPVYSADTTNNGIIGQCNKADFIIDEDLPVYIIFGDHTRSFNIARTSFSVTDNVKVLSPQENLSDETLLYLISSWKKQIPNYGYSRHWKYAKDVVLKIPSTEDNKIDFHYMETYIKSIEKLVIKALVDWKNKENKNN